jgi:Fic family protein
MGIGGGFTRIIVGESNKERWMKSFEDNRVLRQPLTPALLSTVRVIGEFKGKQELWSGRFPEVLKRLQEVAIIQSTESSNRIEGVTAQPDRLRELMAQKTTPENRSEEEIAGYRDMLATIHASREHVKVRPGVILQLHRDLYKFSAERGGHWKQIDNEIADARPDGTRTTRFRCVPAMLTARLDGAAMRRLQPAEAAGGRRAAAVDTGLRPGLPPHPSLP